MEETCFLAVMELWKRVDVMHLSKNKTKKNHFIRMNELTGDDSEIAKWKYEMVQISCMFYLFKPLHNDGNCRDTLFLSMGISWCSLLPHAVPSKFCLFAERTSYPIPDMSRAHTVSGSCLILDGR
jgi:hypothetical protein